MNSPEAASACPAEWREAKSAREALLDAGGAARQAASARAARAVMAQAECEEKRFEAHSIQVGSQASMAGELRAARRQYLGAATLYQEAAGYGDPVVAVGAYSRLADLHLAFARALDELPVPVDVQAPAAREDYRRQMRELMSQFEIEAALAATRSLDAARLAGDDARTAAWLSRSCEKLVVLDPEGAAGFPRCAAAGGAP